MKNKDDLIWGSLIGVLLVMAGVYLAFYLVYSLNGNPQATVADIMAHWPQLGAAPSLKGIRGEVGGQPLPDDIKLEKLPKAGMVWPCNGQEAAAQVCYLNADFSQSANNDPVDFAQDNNGKFIFVMRQGATQ